LWQASGLQPDLPTHPQARCSFGATRWDKKEIRRLHLTCIIPDFSRPKIYSGSGLSFVNKMQAQSERNADLSVITALARPLASWQASGLQLTEREIEM
jgi:hypothetical protein